DGVIGDLDLKRSRAYGLGMNALYVNLQGRETFGVVPSSERTALLDEISRKLLTTIDPATGAPAVAHVYKREDVYSSAGHDDLAPDLVIGYAKGTRVSDDSALGAIAPDVLANNTSAWSGDHEMDPPSVPGVLFASRRITDKPASLQSLAATILRSVG